jgi:hypothetical protein
MPPKGKRKRGAQQKIGMYCSYTNQEVSGNGTFAEHRVGLGYSDETETVLKVSPHSSHDLLSRLCDFRCPDACSPRAHRAPHFRPRARRIDVVLPPTTTRLALSFWLNPRWRPLLFRFCSSTQQRRQPHTRTFAPTYARAFVMHRHSLHLVS